MKQKLANIDFEIKRAVALISNTVPELLFALPNNYEIEELPDDIIASLYANNLQTLSISINSKFIERLLNTRAIPGLFFHIAFRPLARLALEIFRSQKKYEKTSYSNIYISIFGRVFPENIITSISFTNMELEYLTNLLGYFGNKTYASFIRPFRIIAKTFTYPPNDEASLEHKMMWIKEVLLSSSLWWIMKESRTYYLNHFYFGAPSKFLKVLKFPTYAGTTIIDQALQKNVSEYSEAPKIVDSFWNEGSLPLIIDRLVGTSGRGTGGTLISNVFNSAKEAGVIKLDQLSKLYQRALVHSVGSKLIKCIRDWSGTSYDDRSPIMSSTLSRSDLFNLANNTPLFLFDRGTINPLFGKVNIYLDVSGSFTGLVNECANAIDALYDEYNCSVYCFSTLVGKEVTIEMIRQKQFDTTGGTDIHCVITHAIENKIEAAVIFTDGHVGTACTKEELRQVKLFGVLVGSTYGRDLEKMNIPIVASFTN